MRPDKKCNYCYRVGHVRSNSYFRPDEKFHIDGSKSQPENIRTGSTSRKRMTQRKW